MPKETVCFVACKNNPEKLQLWVRQMSFIYDVCQACGIHMGCGMYGAPRHDQHYDLFEIEMKKKKAFEEDLWDRAEAEIASDREKYQVTKFGMREDHGRMEAVSFKCK